MSKNQAKRAQRTQIDPKMPKKIFILMVLATRIVMANQTCLVDSCKTCDSNTTKTCQRCKEGYFLVTYYGVDSKSNLNDCWSLNKLYWALGGLFLLGVAVLGFVGLSYFLGLTLNRSKQANMAKYGLGQSAKYFGSQEFPAVAEPMVSTDRARLKGLMGAQDPKRAKKGRNFEIEDLAENGYPGHLSDLQSNEQGAELPEMHDPVDYQTFSGQNIQNQGLGGRGSPGGYTQKQRPNRYGLGGLQLKSPSFSDNEASYRAETIRERIQAINQEEHSDYAPRGPGLTPAEDSPRQSYQASDVYPETDQSRIRINPGPKPTQISQIDQKTQKRLPNIEGTTMETGGRVMVRREPVGVIELQQNNKINQGVYRSPVRSQVAYISQLNGSPGRVAGDGGTGNRAGYGAKRVQVVGSPDPYRVQAYKEQQSYLQSKQLTGETKMTFGYQQSPNRDAGSPIRVNSPIYASDTGQRVNQSLRRRIGYGGGERSGQMVEGAPVRIALFNYQPEGVKRAPVLAPENRSLMRGVGQVGAGGDPNLANVFASVSAAGKFVTSAVGRVGSLSPSPARGQPTPLLIQNQGNVVREVA